MSLSFSPAPPGKTKKNGPAGCAVKTLIPIIFTVLPAITGSAIPVIMRSIKILQKENLYKSGRTSIIVSCSSMSLM